MTLLLLDSQQSFQVTFVVRLPETPFWIYPNTFGIVIKVVHGRSPRGMPD
jgi:hypothetical protein